MTLKGNRRPSSRLNAASDGRSDRQVVPRSRKKRPQLTPDADAVEKIGATFPFVRPPVLFLGRERRGDQAERCVRTVLLPPSRTNPALARREHLGLVDRQRHIGVVQKEERTAIALLKTCRPATVRAPVC